ncbi:MAG: hypothetical protein ACK4R6_04545 [Spirosomataceae bacterium]
MEIPVTAIESSKAGHLPNKAKPRKDWEEVFVEMHGSGNDTLLILDVFEGENWEECEREVGVCS